MPRLAPVMTMTLSFSTRGTYHRAVRRDTPDAIAAGNRFAGGSLTAQEATMSETSRRDLLRLSGGALWVGLASACGAGAQRATAPGGAGAGSAGSDAGGF
jgi:hypothetical protein